MTDKEIVLELTKITLQTSVLKSAPDGSGISPKERADEIISVFNQISQGIKERDYASELLRTDQD